MGGQWWIVTTIGFIATLIAVVAFFPQSLRTVKTKKTNGISLSTFIIYTIANSLWVLWGVCHLAYFGASESTILMKDLVVICANTPCAMWSGIILGIKINNMYKYGEDCKKWKGKINLKQNSSLV
ncbi:PQ-loop domain-containing transporter [Spiroplasma sp. AdecLV25b]|uniref:SemiSWEET family sugar transporter n=1 Tax=Spiroplasma sp. AdecLV25b TaxID=3027162 RepID=UPI0027DED661|nr:PQ-loop domain-containing transporter [Spiroplasma sp. AdecLV25b]